MNHLLDCACMIEDRNDDRDFQRRSSSAALGCPSAVDGHRNRNVAAPLSGVVLLARGVLDRHAILGMQEVVAAAIDQILPWPDDAFSHRCRNRQQRHASPRCAR